MMLLALLSLAAAETVPLDFRANKSVYTWPAGWTPKGVSTAGLAQIQDDIAERHYPFYVVLIQGEALPGTGDDMERLQLATDELMARWGGQGMDLSTYSVFAVAWGDDCDKPPSSRRTGTVCKYFLNTGSTFINGPADFLPSRDHEEHTQHFLSAVSTTPQDPKGGILRVIDSVDTMLWDRTDPAKLAARAHELLTLATEYRLRLLALASEEEAARYSYQAKVAEEALKRANTDEMVRMAGEMQQNNETLEARIEQRLAAQRALQVTLIEVRDLLDDGLAEEGEFDEKIAAAESAVERMDLEDIIATGVAVQDVRDELIARQHARWVAEKRALQAQMGGVAVGGGGLFAGIIGIGARRRKSRLAAEAYEARRDRIAEQLDNAAARYMTLELDDRETLAALEDTGGRTGDECRSVGTELDDIYAGIKALESHLDRIDATVEKLGSMAVSEYEEAREALTRTFSFDTGELVNDDLFGGETRVIEIDGAVFMEQLQARFADVIARREKLLVAHEIRFKDARSQLPHDALDTLLARLREHSVPPRWIDDHPLFGDDESDRTLYDSLDAVRLDDPLAYLERLETLRAVEAACTERVDALETMLTALGEARMDAVPSHAACVLDPGDDPAHTFSRARGQEDTMRGLLAEGAVTRALEPVLQKGVEARETWLNCHRQVAEINSAVAGLEAARGLAEQQVSAAATALGSARTDLDAAEAEFTRAHLGLARVDSGDATLSSARLLVQRSEALSREQRLLDAYRMLQSVSNLSTRATQEAHQGRDHLRRLERERTEYQRRLAGMSASRETAERKIRKYGGSTVGLDTFAAPSLSGPQDYAALCTQIGRVEEQWSARVRSARSAYEAEQRRKREAAERARRQAAAARAAASRSSRSSWKSSSSGSSFSSTRRRSSFSSSSSSSRRSSSSSSRRSSGGGGSFSSRKSSGGGGGW